MNFENTLTLGNGFYTVSDIAQILRLPYHRVNRWVETYWNGQLGKQYGENYSWEVNGSKAVSFHTLVEFYVMLQFSEAGVKSKEVIKAHALLTEVYQTPFPFAKKSLLDSLFTDGNKIYFSHAEGTITLDGTQQFNLEIIRTFFKNLDFGKNDIASKLWPLGRDRSIVLDPERKFGHPVIGNTNIYPETVYKLHQAGDPIPYIAAIFNLSEAQVNDAITFYTAA